MTEELIYEKIKEYFDIREFVNKTTYLKHGENAWMFIDPKLLHTILVIREALGRPMTINNWSYGGKFSQRGLRTNIGQIVMKMVAKRRLYLSAHVMGKAVDFDVKGMSAIKVREWLVENKDLLPCKIRLENTMKGRPISWVHLDVFWSKKNSKVHLFNV
jgi:hypothetical protein